MLTRAKDLGTVTCVTNLYSAYFKCASTLKEGGVGKKVGKHAGKQAGKGKMDRGGMPPVPGGTLAGMPLAEHVAAADSCSISMANGAVADDAQSVARSVNSGATNAESTAADFSLCAFNAEAASQLGGNVKHAIVDTLGGNNCLQRRFKAPPVFDGDYWPEEALRLEKETKKRKGLGVLDREHLPIMEQCEGLLAGLMNHPSAYPFNAPVDAEALNIPDYYKVVTRPMDLGLVKSQIKEGVVYTIVQDFVDDVRQVWKNANVYNPPRHPITAMASTLSSLFEKELRAMFNCWNQSKISKQGLQTRLDGQNLMQGMLDSDNDDDGADAEDDVVLVTEVVNSPRDTTHHKDGSYGGLGNDVALWGNSAPPAAAATAAGTGRGRGGNMRGNGTKGTKGRKKKKGVVAKEKEPEIKQKYHSIVTYTANSVQCMRDELLVARLQPCCKTCGEYFIEGFRYHDSVNLADYCANCKVDIKEHLVPQKVVLGDTTDPDVGISGGFVDSRHTFLEVCQFRHYQFDTLRNAKHSSAQIIHTLHKPTAIPIEEELKQAHLELHQLNVPPFDMQ